MGRTYTVQGPEGALWVPGCDSDAGWVMLSDGRVKGGWDVLGDDGLVLLDYMRFVGLVP